MNESQERPERTAANDSQPWYRQPKRKRLADAPDRVNLKDRNEAIAAAYYGGHASREELAAQYVLSETMISTILRRHARGEVTPSVVRGSSAIRPDEPYADLLYGCPNCGSLAAHVHKSSRDENGVPIRVRVCDDCGRTWPTAEANVPGVNFSAVDARARVSRKSPNSGPTIVGRLRASINPGTIHSKKGRGS